MNSASVAPGTPRRRRIAVAGFAFVLVATTIAVFAGPDIRAPDEEASAVEKLDPDLRAALGRAAQDAADDGITFRVKSGWRSPAHQKRLLRDAIAKYGSRQEAARWVATPETSAHVAGKAVDIAPFNAMDWLSRHGSRYGLCRIYQNEPWHFELRPEAVRGGCPRMYADPTHDPRMRRAGS